MSFKSTRSKVLASIAVVGTIAAVAAIVGINTKPAQVLGGSRLLQAAPSTEDVQAFQSFVQKHNRNYMTKEEYEARLGVFVSNLGVIRAHDAQGTGYRLGVNKFADMTPEEFEKMQGFKDNAQADASKFLDEEDAPDTIDDDGEVADEDGSAGRGLQTAATSIDWRTKGVLNPIRNQGSCGSCYTFSTVASMEAIYKIKKGSLPSFSEQQILDCSGSYGNSGCSGGLMTNSFNYLKSYKAMTRTSYPYTAVRSTCKYNSASGVVNTIGYKTISSGDVNGHITALQSAPISAAVAASSAVFQLYRGGIISSTSCGTALNHAVNLVGYGTENGVNYWIVRNSWGTNWGESGYFRVLRSTSNGDGICGILKMSSYPLI